MSYCKRDGKDTVIFVTKEDHEKPSSAKVEEYDDGEPGLIMENGEINWNCPCLGGMATGPCGFEFRSAFSCFHHSTADPKGSDCYEEFRGMQDCMVKFPKLYNVGSDDKDDDDEVVDVFANSSDVKQDEKKNSVPSDTSRADTVTSQQVAKDKQRDNKSDVVTSSSSVSVNKR